MPILDPIKRKNYSREWVAKRRSSYFEDKLCVKCGSTKNLQLHHKDPATKLSHSIWSWKETRRLDELEKCEILCQYCHKEFHGQLPKPLIHGTSNAYSEKGCRCLECKSWRHNKYLQAIQTYQVTTDSANAS